MLSTRIASVLGNLIVLLSISACGAIPVQDSRYSVQAGSEVATIGRMAWNGDCSTLSPSIRVVKKPTGGKLSIRSKKMTIGSGADIGKNQLCQGKSVIGREVFYIPNDGFQGEDTFLLESTLPGVPGATRQNVAITVR